jgi:hypothetical protein
MHVPRSGWQSMTIRLRFFAAVGSIVLANRSGDIIQRRVPGSKGFAGAAFEPSVGAQQIVQRLVFKGDVL